MSEQILTTMRPSTALRILRNRVINESREVNSPSKIACVFENAKLEWYRVARHWQQLGCNIETGALQNSVKNHTMEGNHPHAVIFRAFQRDYI